MPSLTARRIALLSLALAAAACDQQQNGQGSGQSPGPGKPAGQQIDPAWPRIDEVEPQPLAAATRRLIKALQTCGAPLSAAEIAELEPALASNDAAQCAATVQEVLDRHCIAGIRINPESRVAVTEGPAPKKLIRGGWRAFLVKVINHPTITPTLVAASPNAATLHQRGIKPREKPMEAEQLVSPSDIPRRFLELAMWAKPPLKPRLSGLALEYRIVEIYSREAGKREVELGFNVGESTQDIGDRNAVPILFDIEAATEVVLGVRDVDGTPTTASFVFRDQAGRVYPLRSRRLEPDFFFQDQVYRADGESEPLPPGTYEVTMSRGPEYELVRETLVIEPGKPTVRLDAKLRRWVHPAARGWYSGDHHIHAAGCQHYDAPTEGVGPEAVMRHVVGEGLNVGCVLTWGQCWYSQKQNFEGRPAAISQPGHILRYDVEVSGFPSGHAGHVCLLGLTEDDYPGTERIEQWPSWTLPVLQWGRKQGAVVGYAHTGWGLQLPDYLPGRREFPKGHVGRDRRKRRSADKIPDYAMPPFDNVGANEFIVTVTHDAVDFLGVVDTPPMWELNMWYHVLNCGFRTRVSGESDFPCVYDTRIGYGRSWVKIPSGQELTFEGWADGIKHGRCYVGDGLSHILDYKVGDVAVGEPGSGGAISQLDLAAPGKVRITADVAALLEPGENNRTRSIRRRRRDNKPYWHIERCRVGKTRNVAVEVVLNGEAVARQEVLADGTTHSLTFDVEIERSSWVALRILSSSHTNPVFVQVDGAPIRASKRSARWCRKAVDVCWESKRGQIGADDLHEGELEAARAAYQHARETFDRLIQECVAR